MLREKIVDIGFFGARTETVGQSKKQPGYQEGGGGVGEEFNKKVEGGEQASNDQQVAAAIPIGQDAGVTIATNNSGEISS